MNTIMTSFVRRHPMIRESSR